EQAAKEPWELSPVSDKTATLDELRSVIGDDLAAAYKLTDKQQRQNAINDARAKARACFGSLAHADPAASLRTPKLDKKLEADIVRKASRRKGKRIDGSTTTQVRPIEATVGFLPPTHSSALFTRGETQAVCTTPL